ncbi:MAG TPA: ABC transporter substrate binding protein, partial [Methanothrix sp.]|nr:ABC transporter substrate binding protein [Methanothrix sp.]
MKDRTALLLIAICAFISLLALSSSVAAMEDAPKQVLILASYYPGLAWEDHIISEIKFHFAMFMPSAVIRTEYMDAKRIPADEKRLQELKALYLRKYGEKHLDMIISADTDAFNFLRANRDEVFHDVPVVFCGVVHFDENTLNGLDNFTGVLEAYDIADTISLMLKLHPEARRIFIVNDNTATGISAREVLENIIPRFSGNVSFEFSENLTSEELSEKAAALPKDSLILLMTFNRDRAGAYLTYVDVVTLLSSATEVPIYSVYDFYMGYGIVGGKLVSSYYQGDEAADLAIQILHGERADRIPVVKKVSNQYIFDYFELMRLKIPLNSLPANRTILNMPFQPHSSLIDENLSYMELYKKNLCLSELQGSDLSHADLSYASLVRSNLSDARIEQASLSYADLEEADLHGSSLFGSNLTGSDLVAANMIGSNLSQANFTGARLCQARIYTSNLSGAKFNGAYMEATNLS